MPTLRTRYTIVLVVTIFMAICGTCAGYYLARYITVWVTVNRLDNYASQLVANGEDWAAEVRTALAAVDASPSGSCSDAEVKYLRALIFESEFLKDAGQMNRNGQIECSAAMGHVTRLNDQAEPDFTQQDGTLIYKSLKLYRDSTFPAIALQRGNSFVVFTPIVRMYIQPPPMHFTQTVTDAPTQTHGSLLGEPLPSGLPILNAEGTLWQEDNLYATRCSIRYFNCVTAYTTIPAIVAANRTRFNGCIALCGLLGAFIGFLSSLLYRRNKSMAQQLRRAIRHDRLKVVYQPIVDLGDGRIVGAEALVRWTDEEGMAVGPDIFVRIAERQGFVKEITRAVLRRVLRDLGHVLRSHPDFRVSINVTSDDLADPGFLDLLATSLTEAGLLPQSLTIEITEGSTVRRDAAIQTIHTLRLRGHSVHIDDFGTGYSSLSYLQDLAIDAIKIDRAFTQSIGTGSVTMAILPQILAMAEAIDLHVIVEGVETSEQAEYFTMARRPIFAQGWLFGRPMPAQEFCCVLADNGLKKMTVEREEETQAFAVLA
ncbi:MAG: EAL domain-containing protein [Terracidiphilus sp.]|jgi:sensor c-di-GMP phosphodiesterase-like protein